MPKEKLTLIGLVDKMHKTREKVKESDFRESLTNIIIKTYQQLIHQTYDLNRIEDFSSFLFFKSVKKWDSDFGNKLNLMLFGISSWIFSQVNEEDKNKDTEFYKKYLESLSSIFEKINLVDLTRIFIKSYSDKNLEKWGRQPENILQLAETPRSKYNMEVKYWACQNYIIQTIKVLSRCANEIPDQLREVRGLLKNEPSLLKDLIDTQLFLGDKNMRIKLGELVTTQDLKKGENLFRELMDCLF